MTHDEAKEILMLYRPGTADAGDPQVAAALAQARDDEKLAHWLGEHCTRQEVLRVKFREIPVPPGLKEQILSEYPAHLRTARRRVTTALAALATLALLAGLVVWQYRLQVDDNLDHYRSRMVSAALRGYAMDLETNDLGQIRSYLAREEAPSDYELPPALRQADVIGCAVQKWQEAKVSMICFRTGRPLPSGQPSDLWLFVVDRNSLKEAPAAGPPAFIKVNRLFTGIWTQGDKVYLLGVEGDEAALRQYL